MLNVSSMHLFFALCRSLFSQVARAISLNQWGWGVASLCLLCALLYRLLPAPKRATQMDMPHLFRNLTLVFFLGVLLVITLTEYDALYAYATQLGLLLGKLPYIGPHLVTTPLGAFLYTAAAVLLLAAAVSLLVYTFTSRAPDTTSRLTRHQVSGALVFLFLTLAIGIIAWLHIEQIFNTTLITIFLVLEIINFVFWFYDPLIYLLSRLFRLPGKPVHAPTPGKLNRLAVIGCAHNEENVIGKLVESLYATTYPRNMYDVYVICDNCTDNTAQSVRDAGAYAMERTDPARRGKGFGLAWMFDILKQKADNGDAYDAYIVLDADNVVNEQYLDAINNRLNEGHEILQTYLGCKNPEDTWISKSYSMSYWLSNVNYQDAHSRLGLSCQMGGTGMVLRPCVLEEIGWNTDSLTEDLVLTARYVLLKKKPCVWVHEARLYDEKPLELKPSVRQRTRWMQGHMDAMFVYGFKLLFKGLFSGSFTMLDMAFYLMRPFLNLTMFFVYIVRWLIAVIAPLSPLNITFIMTADSALLLMFFYTIMQVYALYREGYLPYALWIPICTIYSYSWYVPLFRGLIKRHERYWVSTIHTRSLGIDQVKEDVNIEAARNRLRGIDNLHRMSLGQILLKASAITPVQLNEAIQLQKQTGGRLGEILQGMRVVSKETLDAYLALQDALRVKAEEEGDKLERLRLGDLLVDAGIIAQQQLEVAIEQQKHNGGLLGDCLVKMHAISPSLLDMFLEVQKILDENFITPQRAIQLIQGVMEQSQNNLGAILYAGGLISQYQLEQALETQEKEGGLIGDIIVSLGYVSQENIDTLLSVQKSQRVQMEVAAT